MAVLRCTAKTACVSALTRIDLMVVKTVSRRVNRKSNTATLITVRIVRRLFLLRFLDTRETNVIGSTMRVNCD
jgi:hypothetical protein